MSLNEKYTYPIHVVENLNGKEMFFRG